MAGPKKIKKLVFLFFIISNISVFSQVYTDKVVGKKNEALKDSLEVSDYPYALPIWGDKATARGYDLPYSAGVSINYFWQKSDININDLYVGFNNGPRYNLDEIIRFQNSSAEVNSITVRPDIWLLPFLNFYGIFGKAYTQTNIKSGVWIPDADNNWSEIASFSTKANFSGTTCGLGITPTIGIGGGWFALDMNMAWTDLKGLNKPAFTYIFGPRFGKTFKFSRPESNIAVWIGGFRVHLAGKTNGNIALSEMVNLDGAQAKVDNGLERVGENQEKVDVWWENLTPVQKASPANIAKHATANRALTAAGNFLTALDAALGAADASTVQYSLHKEPKDMWNFIAGSQYQYNKHFMFRVEVGFLGSRTQALGGLQYRFGL